MRVRTLEIRWHDSRPIATCDFQPQGFKKARPVSERAYPAQAYRLATGGEDNHVRMWLVHPNILPPAVAAASASASDVPPTPRPPRVEYVATLSRHSAAVNVVRFSPNGEYLASAGDDGMVIIWAPSSTPHASAYGSDTAPDEMQHEKEFWKPRTTFRCSTMQVYDLAWSPTGEYIITGSTDNCARIFSSVDGKCVHEITEHAHFVQGVAWDPMNEYIATQSSDRSMHVYSINFKHGNLDVHAIGKNTRMPYHHAKTPSLTRTPSRSGRPRLSRRMSTTSEAESIATSFSEQTRDELPLMAALGAHMGSLTPATSVASTPISTAAMFPPPLEKATSSRRSSISGPGSPAHPGRYGRSPSPMPALPAIRALPAHAWASVRLYGDESFTNFFRRLTFSPDGGLLLTPAGQFEDPSVTVGVSGTPARVSSFKVDELPGPPSRSGKLSVSTSEDGTRPGSASSVFIYTRANFARPPVAQLPGHQKASVAVRFSPILYELRVGVAGPDSLPELPQTIVVEKGKEHTVDVDVVGPEAPALPAAAAPSPSPSHTRASSHSQLHSPSPRLLTPGPSPADAFRPTTPAQGKNAPSTTASVFALPYRMLYAVMTMDTVAIYDTQQAGPVCFLTKLHYDEFTDMTWSPDGQCLMLSSRDGYCTIVVFDDILPAHSTQQHALQLQALANHHSVPSAAPTPLATPMLTPTALPPPPPVPMLSTKRREPSVTPSANADELAAAGSSGAPVAAATPEPPKKKRRVALTRVGDVGS